MGIYKTEVRDQFMILEHYQVVSWFSSSVTMVTGLEQCWHPTSQTSCVMTGYDGECTGHGEFRQDCPFL